MADRNVVLPQRETVTLVIPQRLLDLMKKHADDGKFTGDLRSLRSIIASGCVEINIPVKGGQAQS